jgi:spermidine/putrescine-binding protein
MTKLFNRRDVMKMGFALPALSAMGGSVFAQGASKPSINGMIFCHTMGTPADIAQFKASTGVDVNVTCWVSNTDSLTKFGSGAGRTFDMGNISSQFIPIGIKRGLFAPIDKSKIPNLAHLAPQFKDQPYQMQGKDLYSVPVQFGYDSLVYNKKKLGHIDSYGILFDDKFAGQVSLRDDPGMSLSQTALFLGHANPWRMTASDLKEVTTFLIKKKKNFRKLWGGFAEAVSLLKSGEVVAVGDGWISMAWSLNEGGKGSDYAIANPKEKAVVWTHDLFIPKEAASRPGVASVYEFMNWALGAEQAANMGRKVGYVCPSMAGLKLLTPEEAKVIGYDDFESIIKNGCPMTEFPENYQDWVESWSRFKAA